MSAPSESATSPAPCACTNISLMQLFHELKQKFPGVPDHVVSNTIELYCHDKQACETHLHSEVKASLTHAYHASSSAAARQLNELKINPPSKCRNQPIIKHEIAKSTPIQAITCQGPQTAIISTNNTENSDKKISTDANQNVVENTYDTDERIQGTTSPVTVINIDNCFAKYSVESPSDLELTNENVKEEKSITDSLTQEKDSEQPGSTNYRILKSSKIRSNLNERLEKGKEKKTIKKEESQKKAEPEEKQDKQEPLSEVKPDQPEKPKRPNTLDFIKPNPEIAFKQTLKEPEANVSQTVSPAPSNKQESQHKPSPIYRQERVYPLNLSVNVNCHMDLSRGYDDPWLEDYDSPRAITSVNLTVCTPTSNMASPVRESRGEEEGGFEGHVTVTVSPTRPPRRRAPPPPAQPSRLDTPRPTRAAPDLPGSTQDRSLIERQKQRLDCLVKALAQEKGQLAQLNKETRILAAPLPPPSATQKLREYVERLRDQCDSLAKRLELAGNGFVSVSRADEASNFYSNIYTGQQPSASWQCHLCTFRNHPLLNKCEQCEMPRIVGTSPPRTQDSGFGSFRDSTRSDSSRAGRPDSRVGRPDSRAARTNSRGPTDSRVDDVTTLEPLLLDDNRALSKLNC